MLWTIENQTVRIITGAFREKTLLALKIEKYLFSPSLQLENQQEKLL